MFSWLPQLSPQVWLLAAGRLLLQVGTGFTLFYAPIVFVNQVGLSATAVGIALGSASVSGMVGRFLGGVFADSPQWGRRRTLLLAALVSALADVVLMLTQNLPTLLLGNLLMGLGIGLYWPATEAAVADLTPIAERNEAFATTRLADSIGLGLGVILGGWLIASGGNFRWLFAADGLSFLVFFGVIYAAIAETYDFSRQATPPATNWLQIFRHYGQVVTGDRPLALFLAVNVLFTTYIAQIQSSIPLYFSNFVRVSPETLGFAPRAISWLFSAHVIFAALCQLPMARKLNRFSRPHALAISMVLWGIGFVAVWLTGNLGWAALPLATLTLAIFALATVAYTPSASSLVVELAPESQRGLYTSLSSQCWAVGYFIGPPLGGWALDQARWVADGFWLAPRQSVCWG
ncbi:MAG: MFS transporter [Spirulinaceae cyanobacterium SM2_1_0]|nr:MFS transporter [Spirulinaceae cyanobacterium SM2_1_0]